MSPIFNKFEYLSPYVSIDLTREKKIKTHKRVRKNTKENNLMTKNSIIAHFKVQLLNIFTET